MNLIWSGHFLNTPSTPIHKCLLVIFLPEKYTLLSALTDDFVMPGHANLKLIELNCLSFWALWTHCTFARQSQGIGLYVWTCSAIPAASICALSLSLLHTAAAYRIFNLYSWVMGNRPRQIKVSCAELYWERLVHTAAPGAALKQMWGGWVMSVMFIGTRSSAYLCVWVWKKVL